MFISQKPLRRHEMKAFFALLALCEGDHRSTVYSSHKGPVTRTFDVPFFVSLNKVLKNNRLAGDLKGHDAHRDVTLMMVTRIECKNVVC